MGVATIRFQEKQIDKAFQSRKDLTVGHHAFLVFGDNAVPAKAFPLAPERIGCDQANVPGTVAQWRYSGVVCGDPEVQFAQERAGGKRRKRVCDSNGISPISSRKSVSSAVWATSSFPTPVSPVTRIGSDSVAIASRYRNSRRTCSSCVMNSVKAIGLRCAGSVNAYRRSAFSATTRRCSSAFLTVDGSRPVSVPCTRKSYAPLRMHDTAVATSAAPVTTTTTVVGN